MIDTITIMSMKIEDESSDDGDTLYTLGSGVSDTDSDQSSMEDDDDTACQLNDSVDATKEKDLRKIIQCTPGITLRWFQPFASFRVC